MGKRAGEPAEARSGQWVVARTQANRERIAAENVANQGCEYYLPWIVQRTRWRNRYVGLIRCEPLFPRYLFIHVKDRWRFLLGTFGVAGIIMHTGAPAYVRDEVIEKLRGYENAEGYIQLPQYTGSKPINSRVRVANGPFAGCVGIYQGCSRFERAKVLLDFLGRRTSVLIAEEQLVAAA